MISQTLHHIIKTKMIVLSLGPRTERLALFSLFSHFATTKGKSDNKQNRKCLKSHIFGDNFHICSQQLF